MLLLARRGSRWPEGGCCCRTQLGLATRAFGQGVRAICKSKREADLGLEFCGMNSKWGQVHHVELDFRKMCELVSHFSEVVWIFYEFPKVKSFS